MARIKALNPETVEGKSKELLDKIKGKMGRVPNIFKTMAHSPAVLGAYLGFSGALDDSTLCPKLREKIALAVAEDNSCDYCLAAHSAIGKMAGLSPDEIAAARQASAQNPKADAALKFAKKLSRGRAVVNDADAQTLRDAGYTEGEILEIIAVVSLNIFTNYFNHVADPEIDFPKV